MCVFVCVVYMYMYMYIICTCISNLMVFGADRNNAFHHLDIKVYLQILSRTLSNHFSNSGGAVHWVKYINFLWKIFFLSHKINTIVYGPQSIWLCSKKYDQGPILQDFHLKWKRKVQCIRRLTLLWKSPCSLLYALTLS